jgi:hypothetical protein
MYKKFSFMVLLVLGLMLVSGGCYALHNGESYQCHRLALQKAVVVTAIKKHANRYYYHYVTIPSAMKDKFYDFDTIANTGDTLKINRYLHARVFNY